MGYVYLLSNPSMPGLVKIGESDDVENRRYQLSIGTGVPTPFKIEAVYPVPNAKYMENDLHTYLAGYRVDKSDYRRRKPEFFQLSVRDAQEKIRKHLIGYSLYWPAPVERSILDEIWQLRKNSFFNECNVLSERILPHSYDLGHLSEDCSSYVEGLICKLEDIALQRRINGFFSAVKLGNVLKIFVDLFSKYYIVCTFTQFQIGQFYDAGFHEFSPRDTLSGELYYSKGSLDPYVEILSQIFQQIRQEEKNIIRQANGLRSPPLTSG